MFTQSYQMDAVLSELEKSKVLSVDQLLDFISMCTDQQVRPSPV